MNKVSLDDMKLVQKVLWLGKVTTRKYIYIDSWNEKENCAEIKRSPKNKVNFEHFCFVR